MEYFSSLTALIAAGALLPSIASIIKKYLTGRAKNFTVTVVRKDGTRVELNTSDVGQAEAIIAWVHSTDSETEDSSIERGDQ